MGSAFFYTELPDECSLGYTFSKNASKLEYRQNLAKELKPNDSLRILGVFETNGTVFRKVYDYKINANGQPEKQNTSPITKPCTTSEPRNTLNCEKAVTVINFDQYNCSNELIYTEKFDTFPKDAFTKEIRARTRTVEKEFVAFVDDDATCFVENGYLNLKAVWVYGTIKSFSVDNCTSKLNINKRTRECGPLYQNTQFSLPPVYSANLRSKFQFRFGRVDIRARMPRGNYLIPREYHKAFDSYYRTVLIPRVSDLMLVPSGKDTEDSNLPHLRIAFSRGDSLLVDFHNINIGGNVVYGGAYVNNGTELTEHIVGLSRERFRTFSAEFHTYSIIWRNNIIIFLVDDIAYGTITDKNILKDFDTEVRYFFIFNRKIFLICTSFCSVTLFWV